MLLELVQPFLRATVSLEFAEISIGSFNLQPARFGYFIGPSTIVPSLHRPKVCIFKLFTPLASFMLRDLVQPFFRATVSLELAEFQQADRFYYKHYSLYYLGFSHVRPRLYLHCTD